MPSSRTSSASVTSDPRTCRLCGATATPAGVAVGRRTRREFSLLRCTGCGFVWVAEPWTDYRAIYDERYYRGEGSDPLVDYASEYHHPEVSVRQAEWDGIAAAVSACEPEVKRWLDFGCGTGGLVRHVSRSRPQIEISGYDTGAWAERARQDGLPILDDRELEGAEGRFDVVTAIEVIEHVVDPLDFLRTIRRLLRPGGLFFYTTGNAAHAPAKFTNWGYVVPEIHVSYFTPRAITLALEATGFRAAPRGALPGDDSILRFKILKNLRLKRQRSWQAWVPWSLLTPWFHWRLGMGEMPLGRAV